jgi:hypothetical protein
VTPDPHIRTVDTGTSTARRAAPTAQARVVRRLRETPSVPHDAEQWTAGGVTVEPPVEACLEWTKKGTAFEPSPATPLPHYIDDLIAAYRAGATISQLAADPGVHRTTVANSSTASVSLVTAN